MENCLQQIDTPPSKENKSVFAITELAIIGIVFVICIVDILRLVHYLKNDGHEWEVIDFLKVVQYILIFVGIILVLVGLLLSLSEFIVKAGIMCFCIGSVIAFVILMLLIGKDRDKDNLVFNIIYLVVLFLLSLVLWRQSNSLY